MRGLTNDNSSLKYKDDILHELNIINSNLNTQNICVMKFGQVDIEYNIYNKIYKKNENIDKQDFYINSIKNYILFIKSLKQSFPTIRFIVNGVNMPNTYDMQKYMWDGWEILTPFISYEEQYNDNWLFNSMLQNECQKENIEYFDLTNETTDNKTLKPEFKGKDNHFSGAEFHQIYNKNTYRVFTNKLLNIVNNVTPSHYLGWGYTK
tara:strand:- start:205 stop:825 length:621 start_codon:yes stop_codon:yes gene_type:complete